MVDISFREKQLAIIEKKKEIQEQIKILERFFLIINNELLKNFAKKYSSLVKEKEKEIESIWKGIYEKKPELRPEENKIDLRKDYKDKNFRERKKHERKINLHIEKKFIVRENKLINFFFESVEQQTQDLTSEERQIISHLCKLCYETDQEREENAKIKKIPNIQIGEELQKRLFHSILFELMTRKPTVKNLQTREKYRTHNVELRNEYLELMSSFSENNFDDISNPSEPTIETQFEKHKENKETAQIQVLPPSSDN